MEAYLSQVLSLFNQVPKDDILLINTCGWVSGLGKCILTDIFEAIKPEVLLSMHKSQKAELAQNSNEFINSIVDVQKEAALLSNTTGAEVFKEVEIVNVVNDTFESVNVKGSVNRNRLLISKLLGEGFDESEQSKSWRLQTLKPKLIEFKNISLSLNKENRMWKLNLGSKIEYLSAFNA